MLFDTELDAVADSRSLQHGHRYANDRSVQQLKTTPAKITAVVYGSDVYQVRLGVRKGQLSYSCSCPVGREGSFCKHCVAVAICAMQAPVAGEAEEVDIEMHLNGLDQAELVRLVLDAMDDDPEFARRVRLNAVRSTPTASHLFAFKEALDDAFRAGDYIDYRAAYDFSRGIEDVLDSIGQFLTAESAQTVIDLTEYAATKLNDAIQYVDDSDGYFGSISELIAELHHAACVEAKLEPSMLAERLFRLERHGGDLDTFHDSAVTYKTLLKKAGLRRLRELVEAEWANVPALGDGDRHDYKRYRITHMMETIARLTGDVDDVVAVRAKNLSSPWAYVGIVEEFRNARRFTDALTWAQQGIDAFGAAADHRLTECAAEEYERAGKTRLRSI